MSDLMNHPNVRRFEALEGIIKAHGKAIDAQGLNIIKALNMSGHSVRAIEALERRVAELERCDASMSGIVERIGKRVTELERQVFEWNAYTGALTISVGPGGTGSETKTEGGQVVNRGEGDDCE